MRFLFWKRVAPDTAADICHDSSQDAHPYRLAAWAGLKGIEFKSDDGWSHYVVVHQGPATLYRPILKKNKEIKETSYPLIDYMYASCPGAFRIEGGAGIVLSVPNKNHKWLSNRPLFTIGGPVEVGQYGDNIGRLPYIDGCSDSLLLAPIIRGAPCLNHLHFPSNTDQTLHTHPSGRTGIVLQGRGRCLSRAAGATETEVTDLIPGSVFHIPTNVVHAFVTDEDQSMDFIAFHPDSDFGPSPKDHPMVNRTFVNGVSATEISGLMTA